MVKQCCICGKIFIGYGNNPAPVKNEGVCCDDCNRSVVIPKRFTAHTPVAPIKTKCKSCGASIVWIKTQNGRSMPCDADPVNYQKNYKGASLIVTAEGAVIRGDIVENDPSAPLQKIIDGQGYISHFATCPNANQHRKGGGQ